MAPYDNSLWFIETNFHPLLELADKQPDMANYIRPSFWSRFKELHGVMWETNAALTSRHAYDSRPISWPLLRRGINYWTKDHRQIYLLGNPFIWYASLCAIMVYIGVRVILMLRAKRGKKDFNDSTVQFYDQTAGFLLLGWATHFLPFFAMHRQLFLHHYLPALYFSILLFAVLFDALTSGLRPKYRFIAAMCVVAIAFLSYATYAPLTYATPWTRAACERSRLSKAWDFSCQEFPDRVQMYAHYPPGIQTEVHDGAFNKTGAHMASSLDMTGVPHVNLAQAGNHPFEQAPKVAAVSGDAQSLAYPVRPQDGDVPPPPHPPPPPPVHSQDTASGGEDAKPEPSVDGGQGAARQADIQGLDQEGVEAVVLEGTASLAKSQVASVAEISQAATVDTETVAVEEDHVRVEADD